LGDWVAVQVCNQDTQAIIHAVFPRKSWLRRKAAGGRSKHQMIATNIDTAFIVRPGADFNLPRLERYLTMVYEGTRAGGSAHQDRPGFTWELDQF
jgi:ribosome biogenesis GTPase